MPDEIPVIAGHSGSGCDPADTRCQQWFPARSPRHAAAIVRDLRSGVLKMRCPWCERVVRASYVTVRGQPDLFGDGEG